MELLTQEGLVVSRPRSGRVVAESATSAEVRPRAGRARAVLVGGYAGSGKTEFGRVIARETGWAMLDKDTLTRAIVDTALVQLGSSISDRESATYLDVVRPAEYRSLEAAMTENVGCGVSVICTAPSCASSRTRPGSNAPKQRSTPSAPTYLSSGFAAQRSRCVPTSNDAELCETHGSSITGRTTSKASMNHSHRHGRIPL